MAVSFAAGLDGEGSRISETYNAAALGPETPTAMAAQPTPDMTVQVAAADGVKFADNRRPTGTNPARDAEIWKLAK